MLKMTSFLGLGISVLGTVFMRIRSNPAHVSETVLPLSSVRTDPQNVLWASKSPRRINCGESGKLN
jgi:hypothetical protein